MNTTDTELQQAVEQNQNIKELFPEFFNSMVELATNSLSATFYKG